MKAKGAEILPAFEGDCLVDMNDVEVHNGEVGYRVLICPEFITADKRVDD